MEEAGLAFVGPTPAHLEAFGAKHTARELARAAGVPMMAGTGLLASAEDAVAAASEIGFPVMVKATGGGGGIGMLACHDAAEVADAFARVQRLAAANFGTGRRLPRAAGAGTARHVEVQVFGDGTGQVAVLGDRDCSLQRRNQKVIEEAPAPGLPPSLRRQLHEAARDLAASVAYRSAGTVEFVYDPARQEASFLEVNARLQVEHPVTEEVYRVDLVEQMLRLAGQGPAGVAEFMAARHVPRGHAVEARVYAEDPNHGGRPSPGLVTAVTWPRAGRGRPGRRLDRGGPGGLPELRPAAREGHRGRPATASRRLTASARRCETPGSTASSPTWGCCARRSRSRTSGPSCTRPRRWTGSPIPSRGSRCWSRAR